MRYSIIPDQLNSHVYHLIYFIQATQNTYGYNRHTNQNKKKKKKNNIKKEEKQNQ